MRRPKKPTGQNEPVRHDLKAEGITVSPPVIGVGDLAERLSPIAPNQPATIERLRHWTREGFIVPADQHHAGTGKHRRYADDALYDAAILNAFADLGITIVAWKDTLLRALAQARAALPRWQQNQNQPLFLEVSRIRGKQIIEIHDGAAKRNPAVESSITINISLLFGNINR
jgi:DNA-binding transcriptional MerR regulator